MSRSPIRNPISQSATKVTPPVQFLLKRVMQEIMVNGTIPTVESIRHIDLEKLRIVIGKGMAIAYRMGERQARRLRQ